MDLGGIKRNLFLESSSYGKPSLTGDRVCQYLKLRGAFFIEAQFRGQRGIFIRPMFYHRTDFLRYDSF